MQGKINYLDLFSGIGGFRLGLERAGFKFMWTGHSEIDRYANSIYRRHFNESTELGDIKDIKPEHLPKIDLITFGFPCQDLSLAGRRRGLRAPRSGLFYEALRIIEATRPTVFIFENVRGLLHSNKGRDFEKVLREIANLGLYDCEGQLLNTSWLLPQNRDRFFFVGHLRGSSRPRVFPFGKGGGKCSDVDSGIVKVGNLRGQYIAGAKIVSAEGVFTTLTTGNCDMLLDPRFAIDRRSRKLARQGLPHRLTRRGMLRRTRRLTPLERERLQGFPDGWTQYGVNDAGEPVEISETQRNKGIGNAVSMPIVQAIGIELKGRGAQAAR